MGKHHGDKINISPQDEDSYDNLQDYADELEYKARCKKRAKRNQRADLDYHEKNNASKKKSVRRRDVKDI